MRQNISCLLDENIYILYGDHYSLQKYMKYFLDQIYFILCPKCKCRENIVSQKCKEMNKYDVYHVIGSKEC
jgi:hypothetical protein